MTEQLLSCPCLNKAKCAIRRETVVNTVFNKHVCTANEVKALIKNDQGKWATRKSLEFLRSEKCNKLSSLKNSKGKQIQFRNEGMLFFRKDARAQEIRAKVLNLLTDFQKRALETLQKYNKNVYYFSLYDFKKILPYPGFQVAYSLNRLCDLGLITMVKIGKTNFYTEPANVSKLKKASSGILVEDYAEYLIAKRVHELVMYLYPTDLITELKGALRPRSKSVIGKTGGMTFDIFYQFEEPIAKKCFLAIDVYSRLPVNGWAVFAFLNKIKWAKTQFSDVLKDKTYGIILFRNATPEAFKIASDNKIRFINLSKIKIDYEYMLKQAHKELIG